MMRVPGSPLARPCSRPRFRKPPARRLPLSVAERGIIKRELFRCVGLRQEYVGDVAANVDRAQAVSATCAWVEKIFLLVYTLKELRCKYTQHCTRNSRHHKYTHKNCLDDSSEIPLTCNAHAPSRFDCHPCSCTGRLTTSTAIPTAVSSDRVLKLPAEGARNPGSSVMAPTPYSLSCADIRISTSRVKVGVTDRVATPSPSFKISLGPPLDCPQSPLLDRWAALSRRVKFSSTESPRFPTHTTVHHGGPEPGLVSKLTFVPLANYNMTVDRRHRGVTSCVTVTDVPVLNGGTATAHRLLVRSKLCVKYSVLSGATKGSTAVVTRRGIQRKTLWISKWCVSTHAAKLICCSRGCPVVVLPCTIRSRWNRDKVNAQPMRVNRSESGAASECKDSVKGDPLENPLTCAIIRHDS
ncbi:hypothetical protein PR048_012538 [Dryococelus australis]|uniref:Uncharacterized protein n=1 Tax=Dryococelus australis TaxID=614101 RepID=A0ABQ9HQ28_9NEOP|nr:hypothetical protein PR048_012538 [Dryococelus australis]